MPTWGPIFVSSVHIAIYFTTKKTLYTTVHLLLEEFKKTLKSSLSTHSDIVETESELESHFGPGVAGVGVAQKSKDSASL